MVLDFFLNNLSKAFTCSIDINSIHLLIKDDP